MTDFRLIQLEEAASVNLSDVERLAATCNVDDAAERGSQYYHWFHGDYSKRLYQQAGVQLAMHRGFQKRPPEEYRYITSKIPRYKDTIRRAENARSPPERIAEHIQKLSPADQLHLWLLFCQEEIASGSYCKGMISCLRAAEERGTMPWQITSLVICYAIVKDLKSARYWAGPYETALNAAARVIRDRRHMPTLDDILDMIADAEDNFAAKAMKKRSIDERQSYYQFFRIVAIPGGSFIVMSYCPNDMSTMPASSNPLASLPLSALRAWRGMKPTSFVPSTPTPAPSTPGFVEEVDDIEHAPAQEEEDEEPPAAAPSTWLSWILRRG